MDGFRAWVAGVGMVRSRPDFGLACYTISEMDIMSTIKVHVHLLSNIPLQPLLTPLTQWVWNVYKTVSTYVSRLSPSDRISQNRLISQTKCTVGHPAGTQISFPPYAMDCLLEFLFWASCSHLFYLQRD